MAETIQNYFVLFALIINVLILNLSAWDFIRDDWRFGFCPVDAGTTKLILLAIIGDMAFVMFCMHIGAS